MLRLKLFAENKEKKIFFKKFNKKYVHATKHFTVKPVKPKIRNKEIENKNKVREKHPEVNLGLLQHPRWTTL